MTGQKVLQQELYAFSNAIEIKGLKNGMYILSVLSNGKVQRMKLQVND
jgi:hypothetical protein